MRRALTMAAATAGLLLASTTSASAETVTVNGTGEITSVTVNNASGAVKAKVKGIGKPCDVAQYLHLTVKSRRTGAYRIEGSCIQGSWYTGLYYDPSGTFDGSGDIGKVNCSDWFLKYDSDMHLFRARVSRDCLRHSPDRVKVLTEGANYGSTTPGGSAKTGLLNRG